MPYVPPVDTSPTRTQDYGMGQMVAAAKSFGEQAGGLLRDRLNRKQYDDFLSGPNKEFSNSLRGINDLLMDENNPDAAAQGIRQLSSAMTTYMDAAAQYPENPLIAQRAKQTWDMNMQIMNQEMASKVRGQQQKRQAMLDASKLQVDASTVSKNLATAAKTGVQAQAAQDQAINLWSGDPNQYKDLNSDDKTSAIWNNTMQAPQFIKNPTRLKAYDQAISDTRTQMAQEKLDDMSSRGEMKEIQPKQGDPLGVVQRVPWDAHSVNDLKQVAAGIDTDEVKAKWTMNTVKAEARAQGMDPSAFDKYAVRVDPTKATAFSPLDKAVPETTVGKIALGVGGWNQLFDQKMKTEPKNMSEAVQRLPQSIDQLSGPIAKTFRDFPQAANGQNLKTVDDVALALNAYGYDAMLKIFAPGVKVDGNREATQRNFDKLDAGRKANIDQARQLVNAMSGKYAAEIAAKMGIGQGRPQQQRGIVRPQQDQGNVPSALLKPLEETVGAIASPLVRGYKSWTAN